MMPPPLPTITTQQSRSNEWSTKIPVTTDGEKPAKLFIGRQTQAEGPGDMGWGYGERLGHVAQGAFGFAVAIAFAFRMPVLGVRGSRS